MSLLYHFDDIAIISIDDVLIKLRSRSQVRSRSGPGPVPGQVQKLQGPRSKDLTWAIHLDLGLRDLEGDLERDLEGDLERDLEKNLEGDLEKNLEGDLEVDLEGDSKWDLRGDFKQVMEGDLLSSSGQVRSRSGPGLVQFTAQII